MKDGRRIRLAHVIMSLNYGGMERLLNDLIRLLPSHEFENHLVLLEYAGRFAAGLEAHAIFHEVPHQSPLSLLRPARLISLFRRIRPDIVHSHSGVWLKSARAARAAHVPAAIHTEHGRPVREPLGSRLVDRLASRATDCVVAVSDTVETLLRERVLKAGARVEVIINGVDTRRFSPGPGDPGLRSSLGLGSEDLVLGSIGRLEPVKTYDLALKAFAKLLQIVPDSPRIVLVLAGDGSQREALQSLAAALGISGSVRFLGWQDEIERLLWSFDLFTLTSRSEGTSVSLLEAMSSELCAVVTDVGGNRAVLGPGLEEQLVPPGDVEALAAAWKRFLGDQADRTARGRRSRERVLRCFSVERMVEEYAALYRRLCEIKVC
ncbi:MAG: glycosyltransferase [Gemmatimonadales bacterium]